MKKTLVILLAVLFWPFGANGAEIDAVTIEVIPEQVIPEKTKTTAIASLRVISDVNLTTIKGFQVRRFVLLDGKETPAGSWESIWSHELDAKKDAVLSHAATDANLNTTQRQFLTNWFNSYKVAFKNDMRVIRYIDSVPEQESEPEP